MLSPSTAAAPLLARHRLNTDESRNGADDDGSEQGNAPLWLLVRAGCLCALPLDQVIETMRILPVQPCATPTTCMRGLTIIRGAAVPVIDLAALLGSSGQPLERLVTVRTGSRILALAIASVLGIRAFDSNKFDEPPPLLRGVANDAVTAIGMKDAELLLLLRAARLLSDETFAVIDRAGAAS